MTDNHPVPSLSRPLTASPSPVEPLRSQLGEGLKRALRRTLDHVGLELRRKPGARQREPLRFLRDVGFRAVLDIGANTGQFARRARRLFPQALIHAFEPVPAVFSELARLAATDPLLRCHHLALGERQGEVAIAVNDFSPASSLLPILPLTTEAYPYTARATPLPVPLSTLDAWAAQQGELDLPRPLLIKMDVQGYEDRVLSGGAATFASAAAVLTEVSFVPLYQGQLLFDELHQRLRAAGFRCAGFIDAAQDPRSDRPLYADALFLRD